MIHYVAFICRWSQDANSEKVFATLYMPSGVGATCVFKSPFNNSFDEKMNFSARNYDLLSAFFEPSCESVFMPGLPLDNFVPPPPTNSPQLSNLLSNFTTISTTGLNFFLWHYSYLFWTWKNIIITKYFLYLNSLLPMVANMLQKVQGQFSALSYCRKNCMFRCYNL